MPADLPLPAELGRYRLLSKLGQGGMGAVYLAEDTRLRRKVAIKVPHFSDADGPSVIDRFYREARIAAGIEHPNLCPVHDVGEVGGTHFLSMPYVEGTPLGRLVNADSAWPPGRAVALVRKLAVAAQVMHDRGVVHRDLKPANVIVRADGEPVLMDFGLARSFTAQSRQLTRDGATMGTPAYMAPEQVLGDGQIGPAADVYSLGVILFELVTGRVPFDGPLAAVYGQILHAEPPPPSSLRPGLGPALDAVCLRALAKKPADRFPSMSAFAAALEELGRSADTVLPAAPPSAGPPRRACPQCGAAVKAQQLVAGRRLKCPRCETRFDAQAQQPTLSPAAPPAPQAVAAKRPPPLPPAPRPFPKKVEALVAGAVLLVLVVGVLAAVLLRGERPVAEPQHPGTPVASLRLVLGGPVTIEAGTTKAVPVKVVRQDCPGPVEIRLAEASTGVTARNGLVDAGADQADLKLTVDGAAPAGDRDVRLLAVAEAARTEAVLRLTVTRPVTLAIVSPTQIDVAVGETKTVPVRVARRNCPGPVEVRLVEASPGVTLRGGLVRAGADEGSLEVSVDRTAPPGVRTLRLQALVGGVSAEGTVRLTVAAAPVAARGRPEVFTPEGFVTAVVRGQLRSLDLVVTGGDLRVAVIGPADPASQAATDDLLPKEFPKPVRPGPPSSPTSAVEQVKIETRRRLFEELMYERGGSGHPPPPAGGVLHVPLDDAAKRQLPLATKVLPRRMAVIAAGFPYRKQLEEFRQKLRLSTLDAVLAERVRGPKGEEGPAFHLLGYMVERKTIGPDGAEGGWEAFDWQKAYDECARLTFFRSEPERAELQPLFEAGQGLVLALPRQFRHSKASDPYPDLFTRHPAVEASLRKFAEEVPAPGKPVVVEHCLFRFLDLTVQPGQAYRYRFRVRMTNPNFAPEPGKRPDIPPVLARDAELLSEWVEVPGVVAVPRDEVVYAVDQATVEPKLKGFQIPPRFNQAVVQIHRWAETVRPDPRKKEERPAGEWLIAERVLVERGEYVRTTQPTEVPVKYLHRPEFALARVPVEFGDESILVDFEGGKVTHTRTPPGGGPKRVADEVAMEVLIQRSDGRLIARSAADDEKDAARTERYRTYLDRVNSLKGAPFGAPGAGGPGTGIFDK